MSITLTYEDGIRLATQLIQNEIDGKRSWEITTPLWLKEADSDALETLISQLEGYAASEVQHETMTYEQAVKKIRGYIEYQYGSPSILPPDMEKALKMIERGY